jgi:hypothetical protein
MRVESTPVSESRFPRSEELALLHKCGLAQNAHTITASGTYTYLESREARPAQAQCTPEEPETQKPSAGRKDMITRVMTLSKYTRDTAIASN